MRGPFWRGRLSTRRSPGEPWLFLACVTVPLSLSFPTLEPAEGPVLTYASRGWAPASAPCFCWEGRPAQMGRRRPSQGGVFLPHGPLSLPQKGLGPGPTPFSMNYTPSPLSGACASSLGTPGGRKGLCPGEGCSDPR